MNPLSRHLPLSILFVLGTVGCPSSEDSDKETGDSVVDTDDTDDTDTDDTDTDTDPPVYEIEGRLEAWGFYNWTIDPPEEGSDEMAFTGYWEFSENDVIGAWSNQWRIAATQEVLATCNSIGTGTYDPEDRDPLISGMVIVDIVQGACTGTPGASQDAWFGPIADELATFGLMARADVDPSQRMQDGSYLDEYLQDVEELMLLDIEYVILVDAPSFLYPDDQLEPYAAFGFLYRP